MKKFSLLVVILLFISCAAPQYGIERRKADYFDEWGLVRLTGLNVLSSESGVASAEDVAPEKLCAEFFGYLNVYGARLYLDDSTGNVSLECLALIVPIKSSFTEGAFIGSMKRGPKVWVKEDSLYHILYGGKEIKFLSEENLHHRLVCQEKEKDSCHFENRFERERDNIDFKGPYYELSIPANRPFFSLMTLTDPKDLEGYKPLKLDPSILPLESPGYKKLREYEESLTNRK